MNGGGEKEMAQKSETAGIPNDYLLTLLDSFSFEN